VGGGGRAVPCWREAAQQSPLASLRVATPSATAPRWRATGSSPCVARHRPPVLVEVLVLSTALDVWRVCLAAAWEVEAARGAFHLAPLPALLLSATVLYTHTQPSTSPPQAGAVSSRVVCKSATRPSALLRERHNPTYDGVGASVSWSTCVVCGFNWLRERRP
jgi:hypothetical protein